MGRWDDYTIEVETGFVIAILLVVIFVIALEFFGR